MSSEAYKGHVCGAKTGLEAWEKTSEYFPVEMGLHVGSIFSPFLFAQTRVQRVLSRPKPNIRGANLVCVDEADGEVRLATCIIPKKETWRKWRLASESCVTRKFHINLKEMRMLRWMCGHTRADKIRNEVIREGGSGLVVDKPREARPRCALKRSGGYRGYTWKGRGRPKKYRGEVIRQIRLGDMGT
ncbi:hypothetical protein H5410_062833 [Solanum commersonii]|uniref:Uncharacterized protein n=1 Tax=Solanum commersonii TaxID=4109 RepID=A0A9J5WBH7_SOLCO|nr:hypothetical protein H5410_062833 [Solanum commersonii]